MAKFLLYVIAIAVIFGAGFIAGRSYTSKNARVNSYLKNMRSHGDYGEDI